MSIVPAHQSLDGHGTALKPSDFFAVPLCSEHHALEHLKGNETFWMHIDKKRLIIDHLVRYIKENVPQ